MEDQFFAPSDIIEFQEIFNMFDIRRKGSLLASEIGTVLHSIGQPVSDSELASLISEIDEDGSGEIEFDEFLILLQRLEEENLNSSNSGASPDTATVRALFEHMDTNSDGYITAQDCDTFMKRMAKAVMVYLDDAENDLDANIAARSKPWAVDETDMFFRYAAEGAVARGEGESEEEDVKPKRALDFDDFQKFVLEWKIII
jgi:Ca2+-binding EF-hand superfamily protein